MQINIATGDSVINATQDGVTERVTASTRREKIERHIRVMKRHLETETDEQTISVFLEDIKKSEEELAKLVSAYEE